MKVQQLIRDFRKRAAEAGEQILVENRPKHMLVSCGNRRVFMPYNQHEIRHPQRFYKALSL